MLQALELHGGRFSTPYSFIRELKTKSIRPPAANHVDGVRMLTIHGAKGLEAKVVFVSDTQPEAMRSETSSLLVDWDVSDPAPRLCAFIASGGACPPSLRGIAEMEEMFRGREEMNGLYVAMTRAAERLVLSCTEPYFSPKAGLSWWDRVSKSLSRGRPRTVICVVKGWQSSRLSQWRRRRLSEQRK